MNDNDHLNNLTKGRERYSTVKWHQNWRSGNGI